jgi:hypothetical protein
MSQENVDLVAALDAAGAQMEQDELLAALPALIEQACDPEIEWVEDPRRVDGRIYRHNALRCRGAFHLNGEIGGFGDIKYRGDLRRRDRRFNVVGGSRDFQGVAGKWVLQGLNRSGTKSLNHFALVR